MKKSITSFLCLFMIILFLVSLSCEVFAAGQTYEDVDLKIGQVLHSSSFIHLSTDTYIHYFSSAKDEKAPVQLFFEAGRETSVKVLWDTFDWVVLENALEENVRRISLYPYVNDGVGGVEIVGLSTDETVLGGSWMDFKGCNGKTRTIRYFIEGENEPFYTQSSGNRYMQVPKRAQTASFTSIGYTVAYWHVKNIDSWSGTVDLIAGRDIGLANMIKANEMYRTQIVPAGTLIDYSAARYITIHYYSSEYLYDKGQELYCFDYSDRKNGEERFTIAGLGYSYTAYQVMSANIHHVHLVAMNGCYMPEDNSIIYVNDLMPGDVLFNGSLVSFGTSSSRSIRYIPSGALSPYDVTCTKEIEISNPDGFSAGSWVVSEIGDYHIALTPLAFSAEGLVIPSNENQDKDYYSGACVNIGDKKYYYYDSLSVAIADARVNASLSLNDFIGDKNILNNRLECDKVLLLRDVEKIDARIGNVTGVGKGIVIDFNGHNASCVCIGTIPSKETLVFTNSRNANSFITGDDAIVDHNAREARTGTVVFNNLNIASKIHPAMHTVYLLNGNYILNSATVMDNEYDNQIIMDSESCPLYKFYEDYPYWVCSIQPADASLDYPNGKKVVSKGVLYYFYSDMNLANSEAKEKDVIQTGRLIPAPKPNIGGTGDNPGGSDSPSVTTILVTVAVVVVVAGVAAVGILRFKKKKGHS